jgi:hypothetical protein
MLNERAIFAAEDSNSDSRQFRSFSQSFRDFYFLFFHQKPRLPIAAKIHDLKKILR